MRTTLVAGATVGLMAMLAPTLAGASVGNVSYPDSPNAPDADPIQIESFSWGLSQSGSSAAGSGGGAGKASFSDLSVVMRPSEGLPRLAYLAASGDKLNHVLIQTDADSGGTGVAVSYCADKAVVRKLQVSNIGSSGQDGVTVDLGYQKLSVATHLEVGGIAVASFDLKTNLFSFGSSPPCPITT